MINKLSPKKEKFAAAHRLCELSRLNDQCPTLSYSPSRYMFKLELKNCDLIGSINSFWEAMRKAAPGIGSSILKFKYPESDNSYYTFASITAKNDNSRNSIMIDDNDPLEDTSKIYSNQEDDGYNPYEEYENQSSLDAQKEEHDKAGGYYFTKDNPVWGADEDYVSDFALKQQDMYEKFCPSFDEFMSINEGIDSEKNLIILRGLPGSGKTTFANLLSNGDNSIVCCADDHFTDEEGNYNWKASEIKTAHSECQQKCISLMESNAPLIIISNTNVSESAMQFYFDAAGQYGYKITSAIIENRHGNKNVHNVPDAAIDKMRKSFNIKL